MRNLYRRVQALETVLLNSKPLVDYSRIQNKVYERLSDEELHFLESAQHGCEEGRALTAAESSAVNALSLALEAECRKEGFASAEQCRIASRYEPRSRKVPGKRP
jgi:hypothetical protein